MPIAPWPASSVTLIGDAIHTMTPGRGVGANNGRMALIDAVAGYESQMRKYGFAAVLKSREQMDGNGIMHKPVI